MAFLVSLILIWHSCYINSHICMLWLFMYSCYMDYCYLNILILLLHEYFMNIVSDCFQYHSYMIVSFITDIDMKLLLSEYTGNWSKMCRTKHHTGQSATSHMSWGHVLNPVGATSRVQYFMDHMSHISCHHVIHYYCCFFIVKYNKYKYITWGLVNRMVD